MARLEYLSLSQASDTAKGGVVDLKERIERAKNLTPTEAQLASAVLALDERIQGLTVKEFARATSTSIASVQRFCKKLELSGYRELKVELARAFAAQPEPIAPVDVNFPFAPGDNVRTIVANMSSLYAITITDTARQLDPAHLERAARLISRAEEVEIYSSSHNLYPAQMFEERLLSAGKRAVCPLSGERQTRLVLASDETHAAIIITYSGISPVYKRYINLLHERRTPVVLVGSERARRLNPGLDAYLMVSDHENLQNRITQFASHIAVQFVLDSLFCRVFARDYACSMAFLQQSLPYTTLLRRGSGQ